MDCAICYRVPTSIRPDGIRADYIPDLTTRKKPTIAVVCGSCTQMLLALSIGEVPWEGGLKGIEEGLREKESRRPIRKQRRR